MTTPSPHPSAVSVRAAGAARCGSTPRARTGRPVPKTFRNEERPS